MVGYPNDSLASCFL